MEGWRGGRMNGWEGKSGFASNILSEKACWMDGWKGGRMDGWEGKQG